MMGMARKVAHGGIPWKPSRGVEESIPVVIKFYEHSENQKIERSKKKTDTRRV